MENSLTESNSSTADMKDLTDGPQGGSTTEMDKLSSSSTSESLNR